MLQSSGKGYFLVNTWALLVIRVGKKKFILTLTLYHKPKIYSSWILYLNGKFKTITFLKDNIEYFHDPGVGNNFFRTKYTNHKEILINWVLSKLRTSVHQKTPLRE